MRTEPLVPWADVVGPVAIRRVVLAHACDTCVSHEHAYDHTTIVISGRVAVSYDGGTVLGIFGPGECFETVAQRHHTIKALDGPATYCCVFSHRDLEGIVVQRYDAAACLPIEKVCA